MVCSFQFPFYRGALGFDIDQRRAFEFDRTLFQIAEGMPARRTWNYCAETSDEEKFSDDGPLIRRSLPCSENKIFLVIIHVNLCSGFARLTIRLVIAAISARCFLGRPGATVTGCGTTFTVVAVIRSQGVRPLAAVLQG